MNEMDLKFNKNVIFFVSVANFQSLAMLCDNLDVNLQHALKILSWNTD